MGPKKRITLAEISAHMEATRRAFRKNLPPIKPAKKMCDVKVSTIWGDSMSSEILGERLSVVLSDNISIRCGCHTKRRKNAPIRLYLVCHKKGQPAEAIVECTACEAIWIWGEVCAARLHS